MRPNPRPSAAPPRVICFDLEADRAQGGPSHKVVGRIFSEETVMSSLIALILVMVWALTRPDARQL